MAQEKGRFVIVVPLKVEARDERRAYDLVFDALNHLANEPHFADITVDWDKVTVDGRRPT